MGACEYMPLCPALQAASWQLCLTLPQPQTSLLLPGLVKSTSSRKAFRGHQGAVLPSMHGWRLGSTSICLSGSEQG